MSTARPPAPPLPKPAADRAGVRVNLTLTPEVVGAIDRIVRRTGAGRATFLREMIEGNLATFVTMADALDLAAEKHLDAFSVLARAMDQAADQAGQLSLDIKRTRRRAMRQKKGTP